MSLIKKFQEIGKNNATIAGGKGASLGEMTQTGIPVPPGFVVLSTTFDKFLEETDLTVEIDAILHKVNHQEIHTVENASEEIQALILRADMPADIAREIEKYFAELDTKYIAVRSSATAEDSATAAWAGQLDSFLNTTEKDLLEKVKRCWASLFTPRAIFYRFEKELHETQISVAVVVQKMVNSELSGIAFSVHPVTEDYNQLIIEAGFGLGEAIVSGSITPDSYVVEKTPRRIIDINVNVQERGLYRLPQGGNEWQTIAEPQASSQVLNEKQILELSEIILNIERHYGFPCDIEWAHEAGKFYVVQSRPITTLSPRLEQNSYNERGVIKRFLTEINGHHLITWEGAYSPLCLMFKWNKQEFYNYIYKTLPTPMLEIISGRKASLVFNDDYYKGYSYEVFEGYWLKTGKIDAQNRRSDFLTQEISKLYHILQKENLTKVSDEQLKIWAIEMHDIFSELESLTIYIETFDKETVLEVLGSNKKDLVDKVWEKATEPVFESFEMRRLGLILDKFKNSPKTALSDLQFIHTDYFDSKKTSEREALLNVIIGTEDSLFDNKKKLKEYRSELVVKQKNFGSWLDSLTVEERRLADYIQMVMDMRDWRKDPLAQAQAVLANICREMLTRVGLMEELAPYLLPQELENGVDYLRQEGEKIKKRPRGMVAILDPKGELIIETDNVEEKRREILEIISKQHENKLGEIKGHTGSKGKATGIAKIIRDFTQDQDFNDGDILVTGMTRPEFVPLMKRSAGIITDEGGITCHAAIISRELNKPCIIGTKIATQVLKDGDLVEVDADSGIIRIIK